MPATISLKNGTMPLVLTVEDEPLIREGPTEALRDAGVAVLEADSGDAAILVLESGDKISAVISDVRMPGSVDGVGLARWMRGNLPHVPVILISGFPMRNDLWSINPAIAIVVKKPYDPSEIVGWVKSLIDVAQP